MKMIVAGFVDNGEFDPGSERTLVGCFKHASRAAALRVASGELVSNA